LAWAAPPVEGIGEITTCPLFHGGHAEALLPRYRLQQAIILRCRRTMSVVALRLPNKIVNFKTLLHP
jgi:hypothetical protein